MFERMNQKRNVGSKGSLWMGLFTLALMVALVLPLNVQAGNVTSGTLGDNDGIQWTYDADTKTLTVTGEDSGVYGVYGTHTINDVSYNTYLSPFMETCSDVERIVVEDCILHGSVEALFASLNALKEIEFNNFDTSNITDMSYMFYDCYYMEKLDVSGFDTGSVTNMDSMFSDCQRLTELDVSGFDTGNVTNMADMFDNCKWLTALDVSSFDTSNVTNMRGMFSRCLKLPQLNLSSFDTSNVMSMDSMFFHCSSLAELDVSSFDTGNVTEMIDMFLGCSSLTELDLSGFDTSNVTEMSWMFKDCNNLTQLDISSFKIYSLEGTFAMFQYCYNLEKLYTPSYMGASQEILLYGTFMDSEKNKTYLLTANFCNDILTRVIDVEEIILSDTSVNLTVEDSYLLTATITPEDASIKEANWTTSDEAVATVSNGLIRAKAPGEVIITATSADNPDIFATCVVTVVEKNIFADVPFDKWYYPFVKEAYDKGIMAGTGKTEDGLIKFDPEGKVTREQFVQILYNMEGKPAVEYQDIFPDVPEQSGSVWYSNAIMWAVESEIVSGYANGKFGVGDPITREQVALMLLKYANFKGYDTSQRADVAELQEYFLDVSDIHDWALDGMCWAVANNVMKGTVGGKLMPLGNATRAEAATMFLNMLKTYGE